MPTMSPYTPVASLLRAHVLLRVVWRYGAYLGCALLVASAAIGAGGTIWLYRSEAAIDRIYDLQTRLERLLSLCLEQETDQQSYVLTGETRYLEPYREATRELNQQVSELSHRFDDNDVQRQRYSVLRDLIATKEAGMDASLQARTQGGISPAVAVKSVVNNQALMEEARNVVFSMESSARDGLTQRAQSAVAVRDLSVAAGLIASVIAAAMLVTLVKATRRVLITQNDAAARIGATLSLLETVVSSIGDALIVTDENGMIKLMNPAAEHMTDVSSAHGIGAHVDSVLDLRSPAGERLLCAAVQAITGGHRIDSHDPVQMRKPGGATLYVEQDASLIRDTTGTTTGAVLALHNVTARTLWEEEIKASDRRKTEFISVLSHELRNPLAAVRSALHAIGSPSSPVGQDELLAMAERQMKHVVRMVDDLLDVGRLERGVLQLQMSTSDINKIIQSAIEAVRATLDRRGNRVTVNSARTPTFVMGDFQRLVQVFSNLLNNASKYSPLRAPIQVTIQRHAATVEVRVKDWGIGLAPESIGRIFDMFAQVEPVAGRQKEGLGIGLTLARQIVDMHGGEIRCTSDGLGAGSEFSVSLMLAQAATAEGVPPPAAQPHVVAETVSVLVVDDNEDAADALAAVLNSSGFTTNVAYDGQHGIDLAERTRPDALLLDIGMPGMNGYEVARTIRRQPWGGQIVIIAVTGWGQESDRHEALEAGFDMHFVKPVDYAALRNALLEAVGNKAAHDGG
ncbi:response regulator [Paraburkholderia sp. PREW-6R]|uniref:response regulator n=1 Tax=Paraburkholderia sp. PREW-6R TaxID=3141544 RepID=UPI0031F5A5F7